MAAGFLASAKDAACRFGRGVQRVVVTVLLAAVYLIGAGLTALAAGLLRKPLLPGPEGPDSSWAPAEGYGAADSERQS